MKNAYNKINKSTAIVEEKLSDSSFSDLIAESS